LPEAVTGGAAADALATLGGAVAAASSLEDPASDALLTAARGAFVDALQLTAVVCAGVVLLAAVVAAHILRGANRPAAASA
jgi:DHA2 family multidrug resistance protein-like MFS transporter